MIMSRFLILLLLMFASWLSHANVEVYQFDNPAQEETYKELVEELRCLVCQNQSIAESNAELAQDMRRKTYELVKSGKTKSEVRAYMAERYGDFMLYSPPLKPMTWALWFGPLVALLAGFVFVVRIMRQQKINRLNEMSSEEIERLKALRSEAQAMTKTGESKH
jgi:cytochrome c-type biogenesis protein CcmH